MTSTTTQLDTPLARPRLRHRFGRGLTVFATAYGLFTLVALFLRVFVGEGWMPVAVINSGLHLIFMPALILFPSMLVLRRSRATVLVAPAFSLFIAWYGMFFIPRTVTPSPDAETIRLFTYNLHAERALFAPMVAVIRESGADVVALQEMTQEATAYFEAELADLYPYRALHSFPNWYYGRGILSRYPILEDHAWPETAPITVRLQRVSLDVAGRPVAVYNFHAPPSYPIWGEGYDIRPRAEQIADLLELAEAEPGAVLLMGDFNTTYLDENYQQIVRQFADTHYEVGWGLGFTNPDWRYENAREGSPLIPPYNRLDYIFHSPHFRAIESRVWDDSGGSDHLPMYAVVEFLVEPDEG
jgi:vancomycin resistance protein VanJ